jgi:hypothetical protein
MTTSRGILFGTLVLLGAGAFPAWGQPDQAQVAAARDKVFAEADADHNGSLSSSEFAKFQEFMRRELAAAQFKKLDTNGDDQVTKEELVTGRTPRIQRGGRGPMGLGPVAPGPAAPGAK